VNLFDAIKARVRPAQRRILLAEPDDDRPGRGADDRTGLPKGGAVDEDRDRETLEDAEVDRRCGIEGVCHRGDGERNGQELQAPAHVAPAQRAADAGQDNEEPGEEILGRRPGGGRQVSGKTEEPLDSPKFAEIEQDVVADHQDDGETAQEIDLPDAWSAVGSAHSVRILRAAARRQGIELVRDISDMLGKG
jgi:hypothetical protein